VQAKELVEGSARTDRVRDGRGHAITIGVVQQAPQNLGRDRHFFGAVLVAEELVEAL
jgi:hypothetical protein